MHERHMSYNELIVLPKYIPSRYVVVECLCTWCLRKNYLEYTVDNPTKACITLQGPPLVK